MTYKPKRNYQILKMHYWNYSVKYGFYFLKLLFWLGFNKSCKKQNEQWSGLFSGSY